MIYCYYYIILFFISLEKYSIWWVWFINVYIFCVGIGNGWCQDMCFFIVKQVIFVCMRIYVCYGDMWFNVIYMFEESISNVNYCFDMCSI